MASASGGGVVAVNIGGRGCGPAAVGVDCMVTRILMKKVTVSVFVRREHLPPLVVLAAEIPLCVGAGESRWTLRACARGDDVDVDLVMS